MTDWEEDRPAFSRAEEFLLIFKKGAEFTQELLRENERLRYQVLNLEEMSKNRTIPGNVGTPAEEKLRSRIEELEREKIEFLNRIKEVEAENLDFANRYVEIENENNMLANLYVASYQLHSSLDPREVLRAISEIIINMLGAEEFAIFLLDEKNQRLQAVAAEGIDLGAVPSSQMGEGIIGESAASGDDFFADDLEKHIHGVSNPIACIPMKIKDRVIGAIVLYKMLIQKKSFAPVDFELISLLAGHAATAIFSSRLYEESERKRSTIQGFIELITR